jgi:rod shape-determining protein MreD
MTPLNFILVVLVALLAVFWQSAFGGLRHLLGAQVDVLPALIVYASLSTGLVTMSVTAVLGGLFFDSLSANPMGVSILPLFVVGFLIHLQRDLILRDQLFAQFVLGLAAGALAPVMTVLLLLTMGQAPLLGWGSAWQWIVLAVGGGIATPIVFVAFGLFDRTFNYRRSIESSFRPDREIRRGR